MCRNMVSASRIRTVFEDDEALFLPDRSTRRTKIAPFCSG